jgi:hypothetical protein
VAVPPAFGESQEPNHLLVAEAEPVSHPIELSPRSFCIDDVQLPL